MAQRVIAFDDVNERLVRTDKDPATIGSITGAGNNRSACEAIANGASSKIVTFSSALPNTNYTVNANFQNTVDSQVLFQPITVTNKSTTGFTAKWNNPTDSANYELCYTASPTGFSQVSNVENLSSGISTITVSSISPPFGNTSFVFSATFSNTVDSEPLFQPVTVTAKTTAGFTAKWNSNTDSANYALEYHIAVITT